MKQDEIIEMAGHRQVPQWVMKLVCDAVAKEREACAKVCEQVATPYQAAGASVALECANIIRARG